MGSYQLAEILLVKDNPGDVRLTIEALKEGKMHNKVVQTIEGFWLSIVKLPRE